MTFEKGSVDTANKVGFFHKVNRFANVSPNFTSLMRKHVFRIPGIRQSIQERKLLRHLEYSAVLYDSPQAVILITHRNRPSKIRRFGVFFHPICLGRVKFNSPTIMIYFASYISRVKTSSCVFIMLVSLVRGNKVIKWKVVLKGSRHVFSLQNPWGGPFQYIVGLFSLLWAFSV